MKVPKFSPSFGQFLAIFSISTITWCYIFMCAVFLSVSVSSSNDPLDSLVHFITAQYHSNTEKTIFPKRVMFTSTMIKHTV